MARKVFGKTTGGNVATTTAVRNTAVPKTQNKPQSAPPRTEVTHEMIAKRAFEISQSGQGGTEMENWLRAERELLGI